MKKWFTLIEILIAISVFSVGILTVLPMIIQNLAMVDKIKTKTTSIMLAKEGIEMISDIRDANLEKWLEWDCLFDQDLFVTKQSDLSLDDEICAMHFASWAEENKVLKLSFSPKNYYNIERVEFKDSFLENFEENKLYFTTGTIGEQDLFWYNHEEWWDATIFARYLVLKPIMEHWEQLPSNRILKVESHVLSAKHWTWEVVLESFIWNY